MQRDIDLNPTNRAPYERFVRSAQQAVPGTPCRWTLSFLDTLQLCEWPLDELDIHGLNAALFDGMGWTIEKRPADPAEVAREILSFLRWAERTGEVEAGPDYEECCEYLASPDAVDDLRRDLGPIYLCPHPGEGECEVCAAGA